jgi:dihydrofolate synthase/folylpolyglutamate synthase
MGGRLDATNVLDLGVAAITNVQRDHEQHLGRTLAAIGGEKAPIIKRGNSAVTGARGRGLRPILDRCADLDVPLRRAGRSQAYRARLHSSGWEGISADVRTPTRTLEEVRVGLLGAHQAENAAVAVAVLDAVAERWELNIHDDSVRSGLARARWPGRLELLDGSALGVARVLLDGAHNPDGAAALARALADLGLRRPSIVFGAMRGKKVRAVLSALAPLEPRFVFTAVDDRGALDPSELAAVWARLGGRGAVTEDDPAHAVRRAGGDPVVVAGSLYLVGAVRGMITGTREED